MHLPDLRAGREVRHRIFGVALQSGPASAGARGHYHATEALGLNGARDFAPARHGAALDAGPSGGAAVAGLVVQARFTEALTIPCGAMESKSDTRSISIRTSLTPAPSRSVACPSSIRMAAPFRSTRTICLTATASDSFILITEQARSTGDGRWPSRPMERACGNRFTVPECTSPCRPVASRRNGPWMLPGYSRMPSGLA